MIAIGDIHGCLDALTALLDAVDVKRDDTLVVLGDVIDRGPQTRGVVDHLIWLSQRCQLVLLIGNHEEMPLTGLADRPKLKTWLKCGGQKTLQSYGWYAGSGRRRVENWIPIEHLDFIRSFRPYYETESHIFMHAGYDANVSLPDQRMLALTRRVADPNRVQPHCSGKVAVVGHTAQQSGEVLDLGFLICIDTNCVYDGWLTALDTSTNRIWQADRSGSIRNEAY